jgi:hypothetical protein
LRRAHCRISPSSEWVLKRFFRAFSAKYCAPTLYLMPARSQERYRGVCDEHSAYRLLGFAPRSQSMQAYFLGGNKMPWYVLGISNASGMFDIAGPCCWSTGCHLRPEERVDTVAPADVQPDLPDRYLSSFCSPGLRNVRQPLRQIGAVTRC